MRNPARTEAEAFRFLLIVIGGAVVIAGCAYANMWLGVAAAVVVVGGIGVWLWRSPPAVRAFAREPLAPKAPRGRHRVLVLAPSGASPEGLRERMLRREGGREVEVLVLVPALASPVEAVTGDVDERRAEARRSADALATALGGTGLRARGVAGADDPLLAVEDTLREFGADEVVIVGDETLLASARERLGIPVSLFR